MVSVPSLALLSLAVFGLAITSTQATTFPTTVEVDLIFPRNETYAPSDLFPIVFAFQNAQLAPSLDPGFQLQILQNGDVNTNTSFSRTLDLESTNFSSSDPFFVYTFVARINTTNDGLPTLYRLNWEFASGNCSASEPGSIIHFGGGIRNQNIEFTIRTGAQTPDLTKSNDASSCSNTSHLAFNVTDTLPVVISSEFDGRNSCAVFSDVQALISGNPCAVQVDSATASSISAAMIATACAASNPIVSCPSKNVASGQRIAGYLREYTIGWTGILTVYLVSLFL